MPDYGTKSGSGVGARSTYRGGSGYTAPSLNKSGSKASQRRKKLAKQLAAQTAAYERQKATDAAAAKAAAANKFRQEEAQRANMAGAAAAQQEAARQAAAAQAAAQTTFGQQAAANQQAAAQRVAAAQAAAAANQQAATQQAARSIPRIKPQPKPEGMSLSRAKAGLYNLLPEFLRTDNKSGRTAEQQAFHDSIHGADARRDRRRRNKARRDQVADNVDTTETTTETTSTTELPPEILPPVMPPQFPQYPGMSGGLGAFGYSPASLMFESQQGAGQVPYYMAAARNAMNPNLSPAFMNAARNYDILGGMQRVMPRPIEMMSARERGEIMDMGSNFSVPNYNSPYYQPSPQSQFDFFSNMVGRGGGKGMGRPMSQPMARAMAGGLGSFFGGFM